MLEILLYCVTAAAAVRCAWLVVGLVRVIPVHLRARTRKWGGAEVLAFLELPVFLALTALLVARALPPPPANPASLALAAVSVVPVLWFYIHAEERMMSSEFGAQFEDYARRVGRLVPRLRRKAV
jgi:protein-S-isoprenylcysteine O-methyltransferase Ste14